MNKDYTKQLEAHVEQLQQKLAEAERLIAWSDHRHVQRLRFAYAYKVTLSDRNSIINVVSYSISRFQAVGIIGMRDHGAHSHDVSPANRFREYTVGHGYYLGRQGEEDFIKLNKLTHVNVDSIDIEVLAYHAKMRTANIPFVAKCINLYKRAKK
jgi:hypothetical protein